MIQSHFPSVILSAWQSAVAKRCRPPDPNSDALTRPPLSYDDPHVLAANQAAQAAYAPEVRIAAPHPLLDAAKAALGLGLAVVDGDPAEVVAAKAAFMRFGERDPFWLECITEFVEHYTLTSHADVPYVKWRSLTDAILPPGTLPDRARIAIVGDWGTGDLRAQALMQDVATHRPDILIHLGDIYYACTALEANAFQGNVGRAFGGDAPRTFTLCGNHDMYSGGGSYYALLKRLGQPASYFCLRNAHWQLLAADTGFNDFDPFDHDQDMTWLRDRDEGDTYSELDWHKDKLANAAGRRTILMTHHPLFTRNSRIGDRPINRYLKEQLGPYLPELALWLWGHEHTLALYEPFAGLAKGRCVGASGVPVAATEDMLSPWKDFAEAETPRRICDPTGMPIALRPEAGSELYRLGYALLDLDGAKGSARYMEFDPSTGEPAVVLHEESL